MIERYIDILSNGKLLNQREAIDTLPTNLNATPKSLKPIKNREVSYM